jgi:hypothetical protein
MDSDAPLELPRDAGVNAAEGAQFAREIGANRLAERLQERV